MTRRTFLKKAATLLLSLGLPLPWAVKAQAAAPALPIRASSFPLSARGKASFSALIFADSQCGDSYNMWEKTLAAGFKAVPNPDFFAILGDLTDNGEDEWQWQSFLETLPPYLATPFVPVMGNHECYGQDWKNALPRKYLESFDLPDSGTDLQGYFYSFVYGPAEFIVLNTQSLELDEHLGEGRLLAVQKAWLKKNFSQKERPWRIVLMHKDILAYDEYQAGTGKAGGFSDTGRAFLPALEEIGTDLILTGHMHTYRRRRPLKAFLPRDGGTLAIMSGPAGNQSYHVPPDPLDERSSPQPTPPNFLTLEVNREILTITCLTATGEELDHLTMKHK